MFNSPVLDLVILLSFTYFISSLILSAISESIAGSLRLRQNDLCRAMENMFFSAEWKVFVRTRLTKDPNIESLMKQKGRTPAYIPAQNFILAILNYIDPVRYAQGVLEFKANENITHGPSVEISYILPKDIRIVLSAIMMQGNLSTPELLNLRVPTKQEMFEKNLESFYNNTMDRVTGWYKRKIRKLLFVTGFLLAVALNIDTIKISNDALKDENKLSRTVDNITTEISKIKGIGDSIVIKDSANRVIFKTSRDTNTANTKEIANQLENLTVYYERTSGYNLGYKNWADFTNQWGDDFLLKLLGILITAFALQLSSTFWFETITKAINIRAVGKKPEENKPKVAKP